MKQKLFGCPLCTFLLCLFISTVALARSGPCGDGLTYELDGTTLTISKTGSGSGRMNDYYLESYNDAPWSGERSKLTSIQIGDGVTSIGKNAFFSCSSVESITIPPSIVSIGDDAFANCLKLKNVTILPGVTIIGVSAFAECINLTKVIIPSGTETIKSFAFLGCKALTRVDLPPSLRSVGNYIFQSCSNLADVYYDGTSVQWDGVNKDKNWKDNTLDFTLHFHCTVAFNANGHGIAPEAKTGQWTMDLLTDPGALTASGYTFTGWYKDKACTQRWDFVKDKIEGDMTLYAGWKEALKPEPNPAPNPDPVINPLPDSSLGNLSTLDGKIEGLKKKADLKGSTFHILQLKARKVGKTSIKLGWKRVPGAAGYVVYGAGCGSRLVKLGDVTGTAFTHTGLKKGTYYRYFVAAYDANGSILAISKNAHIATNGGKKGNPKSVGLNKKALTLKKKQKYQLKAKLNNGNRKVSTHRKVAYESDKPKVATVSRSGKIKAVGKGTCTIYVYAQNGVFAKCKVKVR